MDVGDLISLVFEGKQPEKVMYAGDIYEFDENTQTYTNVYGVDLYSLIIEQMKATGMRASETRIELVYELEV